MNKKEINLSHYRGDNSTSFTGRKEGEKVRQKLNIDSLDKDKEFEKITVLIPKGTVAFNPSFFLGLFYDSIKKLSLDNFRKRFEFKNDDDNEFRKRRINTDIEDGLRYAENEISRKKGRISIFG